MSLLMSCPNCGMEIGIMDDSDGYRKKYYHKNSKGEPICPTCGTGENHGGYVFVGFAILAVILFVIGINL